MTWSWFYSPKRNNCKDNRRLFDQNLNIHRNERKECHSSSRNSPNQPSRIKSPEVLRCYTRARTSSVFLHIFTASRVLAPKESSRLVFLHVVLVLVTSVETLIAVLAREPELPDVLVSLVIPQRVPSSEHFVALGANARRFLVIPLHVLLGFLPRRERPAAALYGALHAKGPFALSNHLMWNTTSQQAPLRVGRLWHDPARVGPGLENNIVCSVRVAVLERCKTSLYYPSSIPRTEATTASPEGNNPESDSCTKREGKPSVRTPKFPANLPKAISAIKILVTAALLKGD